MPDAGITVLVYAPGADLTVQCGYHDGANWVSCDDEQQFGSDDEPGWPVVSFWAALPHGPRV